MINLSLYGYFVGDNYKKRQEALINAVEMYGHDVIMERLRYLNQFGYMNTSDDICFVKMLSELKRCFIQYN
jgi:hypothetical protein